MRRYLIGARAARGPGLGMTLERNIVVRRRLLRLDAMARSRRRGVSDARWVDLSLSDLLADTIGPCRTGHGTYSVRMLEVVPNTTDLSEHLVVQHCHVPLDLAVAISEASGTEQSTVRQHLPPFLLFMSEQIRPRDCQPDEAFGFVNIPQRVRHILNRDGFVAVVSGAGVELDGRKAVLDRPLNV